MATDLFASGQQYPTNAAQVQQLPFGTQYGIDTAMLQRALAQALLQKGMTGPQGQTVETGAGAPAHYVKPNPTQYLAQMAQTVLGAKGLQGSMKTLGDVMQGYQTNRQQAVDDATQAALKHLGMDSTTNPYDIPAGMQSEFYANRGNRLISNVDPTVRSQGETDLKIGANLREGELRRQTELQAIPAREAASVASGPSVTQVANQGGLGAGPAQLQWAGDQGNAPGAARIPNIPQGSTPPTLQVQPNTGAAVGTDPHSGKPIIEMRPQQTETALQQAESERVSAQTALNSARSEIVENRPAAMAAARLLPQIEVAQRLLESGKLNTGLAADQITELQQLAKFTGQPIPANVPATQVFKQLIVPSIGNSLDAMHATARVAAEFKAATAGSPSEAWDPRSLTTSLSMLHSLGQQQISTHNSMIDAHIDFLKHGDKHGNTNPETLGAYRVKPEYAPQLEGVENPVLSPAAPTPAVPAASRGNLRLPPVTYQPGQ